MNPYEKIKELTMKKKISVRELEKRLGYSNGYFSKWKTVSPNSDGLSKVADYFGVSTDYLLGRTDDPQLKHYDDKTFDAIARSFKADNAVYTEAFESLPLLTDEELVIVNNMIQSLLSLRQKKS